MRIRKLCLAAVACCALTGASAAPAHAYNLYPMWQATLTTNQGRTCQVAIAAGSGPFTIIYPLPTVSGLSTIGHFTQVYCDIAPNTLPSIYVSTEAYDAALPVNDDVKHELTCPNARGCIDFEQRNGIQGHRYKVRGSATGQLSPLGSEKFTTSTSGCVVSANGYSFSCDPGFVGTVTGA